MEKPEFLRQKYELHKSPEVRAAAKRQGKNLTPKSNEDNDALIQNYLNRLENIINPPPVEGSEDNSERRQRNIEMLKDSLHSQFVITYNEIPESYFQAIIQRHKDEGRPIDEISPEIRRALAETLIKDQGRSLDVWVNYLTSKQAEKYPDWLRYTAFRSLLQMSPYDKAKKKFPERTKGTIAPFPDLNEQALTIVLEDLERRYGGSTTERGKQAYPQLQFMTRHDLKPDVKQQYAQYMERKNFPGLYALAVEEFKPISEELLKITDGQWVTYPPGSDPKALVDGVSPYGTGWCIAGESMAETYLQGRIKGIPPREVQVYYSLDENKQPVIPRVAMVVDREGRINEVRGVRESQNLDQYIGEVVKQKLDSHPDGKNFEEKYADMKFLTEIYNRANKGDPLNKEELVFLYQIHRSIKTFGFDAELDPRVREILRRRNQKEDAGIVFGCDASQIAWGQGEIGPETKVYIGPLFPGVFKKNFDHVFTSFPETKMQFSELEIGVLTKNKLIQTLERAGVRMDEAVREMLESEDFSVDEKPQKIKLITLQVKDLRFSTHQSFEKILQRIEELGLPPCPPDVGPYQRLKDRSPGVQYKIVMKPLQDTRRRRLVWLIQEQDRLDFAWANIQWGIKDYVMVCLPDAQN